MVAHLSNRFQRPVQITGLSLVLIKVCPQELPLRVWVAAIRGVLRVKQQLPQSANHNCHLNASLTNLSNLTTLQNSC